MEPKYYVLLLEKLDLASDALFANQMDAAAWPAQKDKLTKLFKTKTRNEWCKLMEGTDVCFAPVLSPDEAADHHHNKVQNIYDESRGSLEAMPASRYNDNPNKTPSNCVSTKVQDVLTDWT